MERRVETWDDFFAHLLRIDFFEGQWETYRKVADARALWLELTFGLDPNRPVLSLGCGEGGIELALARRGFNVTGIDSCPTLIGFAREKAADEGLGATFLTAELRDVPLPGGNGTVCCFDKLGLLGAQRESALVRRMVEALVPGGTLLIDAPRREDQKSQRNWWPVAGGYLLSEQRWDPRQSLMTTETMFVINGKSILLADPYDEHRRGETGFSRYIYAPHELAALAASAGLPSQAVPHQRGGYVMLVAGQHVDAGAV